MTRSAMRWGWIAIVLAGLVLAAGGGRVIAQDNLLANAGFDGAYTGRGNIDGGVPEGWHAWGNFQNSDHESLSVLRRSPPYSWRLRTNSGLPTGGGYQTVSVPPGSSVRFSIWALIWTCDDEENQCRDATHTFADPSSGGRVRIGIDPAGGTDPFAPGVQWSGFASPFDWGNFAPLSVDAVASGGQVTVFTYYTADRGMRFNDVFWDDAALVITAAGGSGSSGGDSAPLPTAAPVVTAPQTRPDGAVVHVVQAGQTLWAISQAYGVPLDTLRALNGLGTSSVIYVGQEIIVQAAPVTPTPLVVVVPASTLPPTPTAPSTAVGMASTSQPPPTVEVVAVPVEGDGNTNGGARTFVLAAAVLVVLGAIGVGGTLAGYVAYRVLRG